VVTDEQLRFLAFHLGSVTEWRQRWLGSQIQARRGERTATLSSEALGELVRAGMLNYSHGFSVVLTEMGREAALAGRRPVLEIATT
jgi:hypothetical protein